MGMDVKNYAVMVFVMNLKARTLIHAQVTVPATLMVTVIHMKLLPHAHLIALVVIIYVTLALAKVLTIVNMTVLAMPITIVNLSEDAEHCPRDCGPKAWYGQGEGHDANDGEDGTNQQYDGSYGYGDMNSGSDESSTSDSDCLDNDKPCVSHDDCC